MSALYAVHSTIAKIFVSFNNYSISSTQNNAKHKLGEQYYLWTWNEFPEVTTVQLNDLCLWITFIYTTTNNGLTLSSDQSLKYILLNQQNEIIAKWFI